MYAISKTPITEPTATPAMAPFESPVWMVEVDEGGKVGVLVG